MKYGKYNSGMHKKILGVKFYLAWGMGIVKRKISKEKVVTDEII